MQNDNLKLKNTAFLGKIIIFVVIFFWFWIGIQNLVPSGKFTTSTDFTGVNPVRSHFIDTINKLFGFELFKQVASNGVNPWLPGLRPIERVVNRNTIIGDPIYMDIKLPARFDELRLRFDYENKSKGDFRVGIFTNKDKWQILFTKPQDGEYVFDLRGLPLTRNIVPIVLGTPKATVNEPIIIHQIDVTATKPPLGLQNAKELILRPKFLFLAILALSLVACLLSLVILPITASTFAVIVSVGSFLDAALLELWRPGFVVNFVDSRIFILLFLIVAGWYWLAHRSLSSSPRNSAG